MSDDRIVVVESKLDLVEEILLRVARHAERANEHNDALRQEWLDRAARTDVEIEQLGKVL
jgi:hypothetical protein